MLNVIRCMRYYSKSRLRTKLAQLNPDLPQNVYDIAIKQIEGLSEPSLLENNRKFHQMLLAGVKVPYQEQGKTRYYAVKLIDFDNPSKNEFLAVRQFWVRQHELKILDHVIFINGIPLVLLEYKDPTNKNATIVDAYHQLSDHWLSKIYSKNILL